MISGLTWILPEAIKFDGLGILACRRGRALQPDLPRDNFLQRQLHLWGDVADQRHRAALAHAVNGGGDGFVAAHGFKHHVGAEAAGLIRGFPG